MRKIVLGILLFSFFVSVSLFAEEVDQGLLNRLKTEGVAGLRAQEKYLKHVHLAYVSTAENGRFEYDYYADGDDFLLKSEIPADMRESKPDYREYIQGKNESYFFSIDKKKSEETWIISECLDVNDFNPEEYDIYDVFSIFPCYIFMTPLSEILESPEVEITHIESIGDTPEETISLDFEINADDAIKGNDALRTGNVQLLPARRWAVKEATLRSNRGGKGFITTFTFTYGENDNKPYQVKRAETKLYFNPDDLSKFVSWDYDIQNVDDAQVAKKERFLKYYGLDEPEFSDAHAEWFRYVLLAVGVLMILAAVVRFVGRKKNASGGADSDN
ncbi:MAG: hypothetical protein K6E55_02510 [Thermoguttaceae bacterium]|nr:hypothetical protein [Thermoguttaceae bacterium]